MKRMKDMKVWLRKAKNSSMFFMSFMVKALTSSISTCAYGPGVNTS